MVSRRLVFVLSDSQRSDEGQEEKEFTHHSIGHHRLISLLVHNPLLKLNSEFSSEWANSFTLERRHDLQNPCGPLSNSSLELKIQAVIHKRS